MSDEGDCGYGRPPKSKRFKQGQSGNRNGRPPGRHREPPYEAILGQTVPITEDGVEKSITAEEAFLRRMLELGLKGDVASEIALLSAFEDEEIRQEERSMLENPQCIIVQPISPGSVAHHLQTLRIVKKLYAKQPHATFRIENWIISKALARLGDRRLTREQQVIVMAATRNPKKVDWPEWWEVPVE